MTLILDVRHAGDRGADERLLHDEPGRDGQAVGSFELTVAQIAIIALSIVLMVARARADPLHAARQGDARHRGEPQPRAQLRHPDRPGRDDHLADHAARCAAWPASVFAMDSGTFGATSTDLFLVLILAAVFLGGPGEPYGAMLGALVIGLAHRGQRRVHRLRLQGRGRVRDPARDARGASHRPARRPRLRPRRDGLLHHHAPRLRRRRRDRLPRPQPAVRRRRRHELRLHHLPGRRRVRRRRAVAAVAERQRRLPDLHRRPEPAVPAAAGSAPRWSAACSRSRSRRSSASACAATSRPSDCSSRRSCSTCW